MQSIDSGLRSALQAPTRVVVISSGKWDAFDLRELWRYRELLYVLAWRDIKIRYKQMALGASWAVLQPLLTMVVFTVFFNKLARMPSDGLPYSIFAYVGLLPWTFFSNTVTACSNSIVGNSALITKVYFPRILVPAAAVAAGLVDLSMASLILVVMMAFYRIWPGAGALAIPPLVALTAALALAVGLWLSALNVKYRDVRHAVPFLVQIWLFVTPVIYPVSFVPMKWRWLLALNPLTGIIEGYRSALLRRPFDWTNLSLSAFVTIALLLYAVFAFRRNEKDFADVI
jgi:lipopolysaccharide transport system permease protein